MTAHYYGGSTLNRASWLRDATGVIESALRSSQARILLLDKSNPLCRVHPDGKVASLVKLPFSLVQPHLPDMQFRTPDQLPGRLDVAEEDARPVCVFLGLEAGDKAALPEGKQINAEEAAYFALDASNLEELKKAALDHAAAQQDAPGEAQFLELRSGVTRLSGEESGVVAQAKSLVDWNKRTRFCTGCGRPTASVWSGWKRICKADPDAPAGSTPCISKQGVHNFQYPRTDSVVIMAILHPTEDKILLGRNKAWPKGFVSCLAGFLEPGESLEEAVRREVLEEAGIRVGQVGFHSSQPWPYPANLMLGCWGVADPDQKIRTDLDNELEEAVFVSRDFITDALENRAGLTRQDVDKIEEASAAASSKPAQSNLSSEETRLGTIRLPPDTAIAHQLIKAWVRGEFQRP